MRKRCLMCLAAALGLVFFVEISQRWHVLGAALDLWDWARQQLCGCLGFWSQPIATVRERESLTRSDVWSSVPRASFPLGHFWLPNPISVKAFVHVHPFFPLSRLSTEAAYAESEMFGLMLLRDRLQEVTWQRKCHGKASRLSVKAWRGKRELVRFMSDVGRSPSLKRIVS